MQWDSIILDDALNVLKMTNEKIADLIYLDPKRRRNFGRGDGKTAQRK